MINISGFRNQLVTLIKEGKLYEALINLENKITPDTKTSDEVVIFILRLNILRREERLGINTRENINLERNKLTSSVLEFIRQLTKSDFILLDEKSVSTIINFPSPNNLVDEKVEQFEKFNESITWKKLKKIGEWYLGDANVIGGEGMFTYLLSEKNYGQRNFTVFANIDFFFKPSKRTIGAGIVLGWLQNKKNTRYFNLLLTGQEILLEGIGLYGGGDSSDFIHLSERKKCQIRSNSRVDLKISVEGERIIVVFNNDRIYQFKKPGDMVGRVGLRPWRTSVLIHHFEVNNK